MATATVPAFASNPRIPRHRQLLSYRSIWSVLSAWSVLSIASAASFLSVGSFASILSIGSSKSVLSIGSHGGLDSPKQRNPIKRGLRLRATHGCGCPALHRSNCAILECPT